MKKLIIAILMGLIGGGGATYFGQTLGFIGGETIIKNLTNASSTVRLVSDVWSNPVPQIAVNTSRVWINICKPTGYDKFWLHMTNSTSSGIGKTEGIELTTTTPCFTMGNGGRIWPGMFWAVGDSTTTFVYSEASE